MITLVSNGAGAQGLVPCFSRREELTVIPGEVLPSLLP